METPQVRPGVDQQGEPLDFDVRGDPAVDREHEAVPFRGQTGERLG